VVEEKTKEGDLKIYTALPILLNILLLGSLASPNRDVPLRLQAS